MLRERREMFIDRLTLCSNMFSFSRLTEMMQIFSSLDFLVIKNIFILLIMFKAEKKNLVHNVNFYFYFIDKRERKIDKKRCKRLAETHRVSS
jgi:hypothetical protein